MENILELQDLSKAFPKSDFKLENFSYSLPYGAIGGFVGENGAGKTTTIGCILNTMRRDGGTVKLFGREMTDADTEIREKIGVVYDGDNFPGYWSAKQLSRVMEGIYRQWDNALFQKYLEDFRLPAGQKIKHYSRGMTMKLAVAAALSHHPELLVLDEATSGLDPVMRDEMLDVFLEFVQEENHSILLLLPYHQRSGTACRPYRLYQRRCHFLCRRHGRAGFPLLHGAGQCASRR